MVCDLAHRPLTGLRVLDLACAHGYYSFEMARLGAQVLGIEGRESWLENARRTKQEASIPNVEFVQDDVRNLSKEKYGEFDIVLCLGILYHLDAPDVFEFLGRVFEVCREFAFCHYRNPFRDHARRRARVARQALLGQVYL